MNENFEEVELSETDPQQGCDKISAREREANVRAELDRERVKTCCLSTRFLHKRSRSRTILTKPGCGSLFPRVATHKRPSWINQMISDDIPRAGAKTQRRDETTPIKREAFSRMVMRQ